MIIVFGSINMDMVFTPERAPDAGETILMKEYLTFPGGKGANQAVAAARMGSKVRFAGCTGKDAFGQYLLDFIKGQNVDTSLTQVSDTNTGTAIITVESNGENRIMVAAGSNLDAKASQIPSELLTTGNSILMQMETDPSEIELLAKTAKGKADRVILNLAPALPVSETTLNNIDFLILNELEIIQLGKQLGIQHSDFTDMAKEIAKKYDLTCVITLGGKGAVSFGPDGTSYSANAITIDKVVDTTGAGDAFCGTFTAMLDQGQSIEQALSTACIAGSLACTKQGAMSSYPTREEVLKLA